VGHFCREEVLQNQALVARSPVIEMPFFEDWKKKMYEDWYARPRSAFASPETTLQYRTEPYSEVDIFTGKVRRTSSAVHRDSPLS
jgi:hypothetical protein